LHVNTEVYLHHVKFICNISPSSSTHASRTFDEVNGISVHAIVKTRRKLRSMQ